MIRTDNLTKTFDDFTALSGVNCKIPDGCIYGMVGSNGAGKSTFLRLIAGIYQADEGVVTFDDKPVYENPEVKRQIAFVPDDLYFLQGSNMNKMANFYASVYETLIPQKISAAFPKG